MFGANKEAQTRIGLLTSLLAITGGIKEAEKLPTEAEFSAHMEGVKTAAANAALEPVNVQLAASQTENAALRAALAENGIVFAGEQNAGAMPALAAGETLSGKISLAIKAALENRTTKSAAKVISAAGHPSALEISPAEPANAAEATPSTAEEFMAAHKAIKDPRAKAAYFKKHEHRFPVR